MNSAQQNPEAIPQEILPLLQQLRLPAPDSHKGQNGKLLIIGGSELFHAASRWSLDVASKLVDMVFYSSVPSNNMLIQQAKSHFQNGIVIERSQLSSYLDEADCVLIGPGMAREPETAELTNQLLRQQGTKKWVIDAGALQQLDPSLLTASHLITPHHQELVGLATKVGLDPKLPLLRLSRSLNGCTILLKGQVDRVATSTQEFQVPGGNAGMTKGGTGDVLAGLAAGLYCHYDILTSAVVASWVNKAAADQLWQTVGPYFNASDLADQVPKTLWQLQQQLTRLR